MDAILDFLSNYYLYFLIAAGIFTFALIGFIVDARKKQKNVEGYGVNDTPVAQTIEATNNVVAETPVTQVPVTEAPSSAEPEVFTDISNQTPEVAPIVDTPIEAIPSEPISSPVESIFGEASSTDVNEPVMEIGNVQPAGEPIQTLEFDQAPVETSEPVINSEPTTVDTTNQNNG